MVDNGKKVVSIEDRKVADALLDLEMFPWLTIFLCGEASMSETVDPHHWGFPAYVGTTWATHAKWGPRGAGDVWSVLDHLLEADRPPEYGRNSTLERTNEESKELQTELHDLMSSWRDRSRTIKASESESTTRNISIGVGMASE